MKLIRFGPAGKEKPGIILSSGANKDVSSHFDDWNHDFFQSGGLKKLSDMVAAKSDDLPDVPDKSRMGSCIARPGKLIGIGLNYKDHAKEAGMPIPKEPIMFLKGSNTVIGPYDTILIPRKSSKTDWEVELGVIIGKDARYLDSPEQAGNYIAGYCLSNDVSEREFQIERGGQWTKGKSCDNFNPTGPYLATPDEVDDVKNLNMTLKVNGEIKQQGNTSSMIFDVYFIVYYLSQFMTLEAGDLITTGTPPGVGMGRKPPEFLKEGDEVELSVQSLGTQKQTCKNA